MPSNSVKSIISTAGGRPTHTDHSQCDPAHLAIKSKHSRGHRFRAVQKKSVECITSTTGGRPTHTDHSLCDLASSNPNIHTCGLHTQFHHSFVSLAHQQLGTSWLDIAVHKNWGSHIDASHSRQPLVKGERLVRYEVNTVMEDWCNMAIHNATFNMLNIGFVTLQLLWASHYPCAS